MSFQLPNRGGGRFVFNWPAWLSGGLATAFGATSLETSVAELGPRIEPFLKQVTPAGARLRLPPDVLSAVPWEFLAPKAVEVFYRSRLQDTGVTQTARWMQGALSTLGFDIPVTGSASDPKFREALETFYLPGETTPHNGLRQALKQKAPPDVGQICLIEPTSDWQFSHKRGYAIESVDVEHIYQQSGLSVFRSPMDMPLRVVHIVAGLQQDTSGTILLDLEAGSALFNAMSARSDALTLNSFLSTASASSDPVVLVDVPMPPDSTEANRQALLRNLFCTTLFELGGCRAVLGMGLFPFGQAAGVFQQLATSLSFKPSLAELHRALMPSVTAVAPPALWTDDPDLPIR